MDQDHDSPRGRFQNSESVPPRRHRALLGAALLVGITGNILVQGSQGPGLNMLLFFVTLALAIGAATRVAGRPPSREAWSWIIGGTALSAGLALRASPALQVAGFLAASMAFTFPALRAGTSWMRGSGVSDHLEAGVGAMVHAGFGGLRVVADVLPSHAGAPVEGEDPRPHRVAAILRGLLLAAPLLLVFGALFVSADRVFSDLVTGLLGPAIDKWASHLVVTGILAWLASGYLSGFLTGTRLRGVVEGRMRRPTIGIVEVGVALGLVALLFTAFVAVQFRYLFGGAGLVEVTPGLTYSEYAREGFGQLALASALVLPTLLISDWLLLRPNRRGRRIFRALGSVQLLLLVLVIASAFQRVRAYQEAYGLTEFRFYGVVFLAWLALLSLWFGLTVLSGRRERFAFPALLSGFVLVATLFVANPDAWIARTNLTRGGMIPVVAFQEPAASRGSPIADAGESASETPPHRPSLDAAYLASLSADAVPTLLRALPGLPPEPRCQLAQRLVERWDADVEVNWRSWNRGVMRARRGVRAERQELHRMIDRGAGCPDR